jgi:DnaJ family protein C protein 19
MILLLLGLATLLVLMGALGMFSRARVDTIKSFGIWTVAIGGLALAVLLFLTGRGATAIAALAMLGPLVWSWVGQSRMPGSGILTPRAAGMSRAEAYQVLGLQPGASEADIRAAHRRLMQTAHPDLGGSDWLATRINQARDVLLRK